MVKGEAMLPGAAWANAAAAGLLGISNDPGNGVQCSCCGRARSASSSTSVVPATSGGGYCYGCSGGWHCSACLTPHLWFNLQTGRCPEHRLGADCECCKQWTRWDSLGICDVHDCRVCRKCVFTRPSESGARHICMDCLGSSDEDCELVEVTVEPVAVPPRGRGQEIEIGVICPLSGRCRFVQVSSTDSIRGAMSILAWDFGDYTVTARKSWALQDIDMTFRASGAQSGDVFRLYLAPL